MQGCGDAGISTREIFLRTEGNALVLMDTLNMIRQDGWKEGRPAPRIDMLIQLWLEKLTKEQRKVLDALSIFCGACGAGGAGAVGGKWIGWS